MRFALVILLTTSSTFADCTKTADTKNAIRNAVTYLENNVTKLPESSGTPRKQFVYATTGLVYVVDPNAPTGASRIKPIKEYLVRYIGEVEKRLEDPQSLPLRHGSFSSNNLIQYTWPIAQTLLFFGELRGRGHVHERTKGVHAVAARVHSAAGQEPAEAACADEEEAGDDTGRQAQVARIAAAADDMLS